MYFDASLLYSYVSLLVLTSYAVICFRGTTHHRGGRRLSRRAGRQTQSCECVLCNSKSRSGRVSVNNGTFCQRHRSRLCLLFIKLHSSRPRLVSIKLHSSSPRPLSITLFSSSSPLLSIKLYSSRPRLLSIKLHRSRPRLLSIKLHNSKPRPLSIKIYDYWT